MAVSMTNDFPFIFFLPRPFDWVQGPFDWVQGPFDWVQGPFDWVQGPFDSVQGPFDSVQTHVVSNQDKNYLHSILACMTTAVYTQQEFESIIHHGVQYTIPNEVLQKIMELEALMRTKTAIMSHHFEVRRGAKPKTHSSHASQPHYEKKQSSTSWTREPPALFKPTLVATPKEGKDKVLQRIQTSLNKISKSNFESQCQEIDDAMASLEDMSELKHVVEEIYAVCARNMALGEVYADLYGRYCKQEDLFLKVLHEQRQVYCVSYDDIHYVDPEQDNDGFCMYTKKNAVRRSTTKFFVHHFKNGILEEDDFLSLVQFMLDKVTCWVATTTENRRNELEEVTENLFLALSTGALKEPPAAVVDAIRAFSKTVVKDTPNMTSRAKFKYQDLVKAMGLGL